MKTVQMLVGAGGSAFISLDGGSTYVLVTVRDIIDTFRLSDLARLLDHCKAQSHPASIIADGRVLLSAGYAHFIISKVEE